MGRIFAFFTGIAVGWIVSRLRPSEEQAGRAVTVPGPQRAASEAPVKRPSAASAARDALTEIDGIGPTFEQALNAAGIRTFADLAQQDPDELAARLPARITADRIRRDRWIEQARRKAAENSGS